MTRKLLTALAVTMAIGTPLVAQEPNVFRNPCERGPWPHVSIINHERARFVTFLQEVRPTMPIDVAHEIASQMCDDMPLVGDSDGLTQKVNSLLREYGY